MTTVRKRPDAPKANRTSDTNPTPDELVREARESAQDAFSLTGCPAWCTTPVQCQREIDAGATDLEHVGPVATIRTPRNMRVDVLITVGVMAYDAPGDPAPMRPRVRLELADLIGGEVVAVYSMLDPETAVEVATALLVAARDAAVTG